MGDIITVGWKQVCLGTAGAAPPFGKSGFEAMMLVRCDSPSGGGERRADREQARQPSPEAPSLGRRLRQAFSGAWRPACEAFEPSSPLSGRATLSCLGPPERGPSQAVGTECGADAVGEASPPSPRPARHATATTHPRAARAPAGEQAGRAVDEAPMRARIKRGEYRIALELLMGAYGDAVYAFCLRILKDAALAEDVRQKAFIQAYEGMSSFAGGSSLRTWLLGIAKYRSLDALRALRRETPRCRVECDAIDEVVDGEHDLGKSLEMALAARTLAACLKDCVSADEKALISMHYRDELTYEEMGERLGEKADTLRARVARALVKLRRGLEIRGVELQDGAKPCDAYASGLPSGPRSEAARKILSSTPPVERPIR